MKTYAQVQAIQYKNRERLLSLFPTLNDHSGIYFLRREEDGIKYAYVGQAKHILSRLVQHLSGYQHIDLSLKKHGFYSAENPTGYLIDFVEAPVARLDELERGYICLLAQNGFQLRNKTLGGQNTGKTGIAENKPARGYRDGLAQGYKNARRDVAKLFEKNLVYGINGAPNKHKENALKKFEDFLKND